MSEKSSKKKTSNLRKMREFKQRLEIEGDLIYLERVPLTRYVA
jgi:hypothetical protein